MRPRIAFHRRIGQPRSGTAWVLGGGGARGAAQVGTLLALLEAGVKPPSAIVGASVGALDGATLAARPSLEGAHILEDLWLSESAHQVFHVHPMGMFLSQMSGRFGPLSAEPVQKLIEKVQSLSGCMNFEDLKLKLLVVATDINAGRPALFRSGPLLPALLASTAIPGLYPPVRVQGRDYSDGGVVDNVPISTAVREGYRNVLAIGLMAGAQLRETPASWAELIARTLQLSLHQRLLSDFERLRSRARIAVICPITRPAAAWDMNTSHVEELIERSREATATLLARTGGRLFDRSAIHYLDLREHSKTKTIWLADAL
jgi:NTE family protein